MSDDTNEMDEFFATHSYDEVSKGHDPELDDDDPDDSMFEDQAEDPNGEE